ncbi:MAG: hypothetical protein ACNA8L_12835, partial [Luteolibacter sp.]
DKAPESSANPSKAPTTAARPSPAAAQRGRPFLRLKLSLTHQTSPDSKEKPAPRNNYFPGK